MTILQRLRLFLFGGGGGGDLPPVIIHRDLTFTRAVARTLEFR